MNDRERSEYSVLTECEIEKLEGLRKSIRTDTIVAACGILCLGATIIRAAAGYSAELLDVILLSLGSNSTLFGTLLGIAEKIKYEREKDRFLDRAEQREAQQASRKRHLQAENTLRQRQKREHFEEMQRQEAEQLAKRSSGIR